MTQERDHERESPLAQKKHCEFHSHVCLIAVYHHIDQFIVCFIYSHAVIKFQLTDLLYTIEKSLIQTSVIQIFTEPK